MPRPLTSTCFLNDVLEIGRDDIDVMLEVKDKNLSAIKSLTLRYSPHHLPRYLSANGRATNMRLWSAIRRHIGKYPRCSNRGGPDPFTFYRLASRALETPIETGERGQRGAARLGLF